MTALFYDCEFLEDGRTIDLISIAMVRETGEELYLISEDIDQDPLNERIRANNWLMENVIARLPLKTRYDGKPALDLPGAPNVYPRKLGHFGLDLTDNRIASRRYIRNAVRDFVLGTPGPVELWADYGAYDHVLLAQLFGPMVQLPEGFPMWTHDLRQEVERLGMPDLPAQDAAAVHDALADARWLRDAYNTLYPF